VLGSAQPDAVARPRNDVEVVRRRTGGGAVLLVPGEFTWIDVTIPRGDPLHDDDVGRAFHWLGETWAAALGALGLDPVVHTGPPVASPWSSTICFAGIGSVRHGIIRDSGMIQSVRIMTIEEPPRILTLSGDDVGFVFHSWGTTGIMLEAQLKLVPAEKWIDCIATFPTYGDVIAFGNAAFDSDLDIFLLSAVERRFGPFYKRLQKYFDGSRDAMFSMVKESDVDRYFALAATFNGHRSMAVSDTQSAAANLRRIHETAFNHTTLMALQVDRGWTYLQVVMPNPYEPKLAEEQMRRFGDEVLMHHEYTKEKGRCRIGGLPLIRYTTEQRLNEIMRSFEADGCMLNNPHIFKLEDGGRFDPEGRKMAFRASVDPMKLLNPGKLRSLS